jgi:flagellin-like protein
MKKGISTIIAVILLLIITISLAGTAYMFIIGMLSRQMSKPILILGASCNATNHITLVISNDGTEPIEENEIDILIDGERIGTFGKYIGPKNTNISSDFQGNPDSNNVRAISPSNSVEITVWC